MNKAKEFKKGNKMSTLNRNLTGLMVVVALVVVGLFVYAQTRVVPTAPILACELPQAQHDFNLVPCN